MQIIPFNAEFFEIYIMLEITLFSQLENTYVYS
jgi:hypothetical protein